LEKELGSLEPGKYADLVVLSQDVLSQDAEVLADIEVKLTLVGGETVYEGEND